MHDISDARRARYDTPVGASGLPRIPFQKLAASDYFEHGLVERLTVFRCNGGGDFLLPVAQDRCGFVQDIGPFTRRYLPPNFKPPGGRLNGIVQVAFLRMRQAPNLLFRCRIQNWQVAGGLAPFSVDVEM